MKKFNIGPIHDIPHPRMVTLCLVFCVLGLSAIMVLGINTDKRGDDIQRPVEVYIQSNNLAAEKRKAYEDLEARKFEQCVYKLHSLSITLKQANTCGYSN